jgi:curved DNA-binding protein CbpA
MRTYYDVLGVAADTPDVVIKAAFRALAKEYHPDRAHADSGDTDRFIEIQTAYSVLSKPDSRSRYDLELEEAFVAFAPPPADTPGAGETLFPVPWSSEPHDAADIERICTRLSLYSEPLAQAFHEACLRGECGNDPWSYAEEMENGFFREYFGEDPDVQAFARLLLLRSLTGAAASLNQLVAGGNSPPLADMRSILTPILDQHFKDEALFAEWLKVKFGLHPVDAQPLKQAASSGFPATDDAPAAPVMANGARPSQHAAVLRPVALVFIWAVALYFVLFAALPIMQ